jgi:hypothetical protein
MKKTILTTVILLAAAVALGQGIQINSHMVVEPGTSVHANTNLDVNTGELLLKPNATLIMGNGRTLSVNEGGAIKVLGNAVNQATITSNGYFVFIVSHGGSIGAEHATFEKMSGNGLNIQPGAEIDTDNPLSHCTFQNGSSGSTLLTINNNQYLTIEGAMFISSPGMELYNVAKTLGQGIVNFVNYSGNFSGEDFENDNFNRIFWGASVPFEEMATGTAGYGVELCFDALDVITVENLMIENGGIVNLVAGQRILLLPGVLVQSGGKLHAWISTDGMFCNPSSLLASFEEKEAPAQFPEKLWNAKSPLRAYPNPTSGKFVLELSEPGDQPTLIIEVYSMLGENLLKTELPAKTNYEIDLTGRQPGMYIVRVIRGQEMDFVKVVKR